MSIHMQTFKTIQHLKLTPQNIYKPKSQLTLKANTIWFETQVSQINKKPQQTVYTSPKSKTYNFKQNST